MKVYDVTDKAFVEYGRVIEGVEVSGILDVLRTQTPIPEGTVYVPDFEPITSLEEAKRLSLTLFGGVPAQFGFCNGHNTKLNCLEYHRDSEFNLGTEEFILLLARQEEITDGFLDTSKVKAFLVPAGVLVEVYATTLHYAPCCTDNTDSFRVLVALPWGTNTEVPENFEIRTTEDALLTARNKWLLAHADSDEAANGALVRLTGPNLSV